MFARKKTRRQPGPHFLFYDLHVFFENCLSTYLIRWLLRTRNRAELKLWGNKKVEQENPQRCLCPINYNYVLNISSTFLVEGICSKLGLTRSDSTQIGFFSASSTEIFTPSWKRARVNFHFCLINLDFSWLGALLARGGARKNFCTVILRRDSCDNDVGARYIRWKVSELR